MSTFTALGDPMSIGMRAEERKLQDFMNFYFKENPEFLNRIHSKIANDLIKGWQSPEKEER